MAGIKGRSGRKPLRQERQDIDLYKLCSSYLANNFSKFSKEDKLKVAVEMVKKFGVAKIDNSHSFDHVTVTVNVKDRDGIRNSNRLTREPSDCLGMPITL